nr:hypothetical protein BaRGS_007524 [Batillaria attramentaria]
MRFVSHLERVAEHACSTNPCAHGGTCVDIINGFACNCPTGWTGETCLINIDECESNPCLHGGTCEDRENGYECVCLSGWQGPHCQLDADECSGSPCANAYACQNLYGDYRCDCQPGWTGKRCDINIDNCRDISCQNRASCVDLVDDYYCACLPGYTGHLCEQEIDECASNPCQNGATCVDTLAAFQCQCAKGYTGIFCQIDADPCSPNPCKHGASCFNVQGDYFCHCQDGWTGKDCSTARDHCTAQSCITIGFSFQAIFRIGKHFPLSHFSPKVEPSVRNQGTCVNSGDSFTCLCRDGFEGATCQININDCNPASLIWCGPHNCLTHPNLTEAVMECAPDHTCVVQTQQTCLTPPCLPWGTCVPTASVVRDTTPPGADASCVPNAALLTTTCAKIQLIFDMSKMPMGMSVEGICKSLRQLSALKRIVQRHTLYIMCAMKGQQHDSVEITISTNAGGGEGRVDPVLQAAVDRVTDMISHKQTNSSALSSVVEIRVETSLASATAPGQGYVIPLVCSMMGVMGILSIILLVVWHNKRTHNHRKHLQELYFSDQKTNNENEENLRRYRNPLFDTVDKGGGRGTSKNVPTQELQDYDLEKYEKSPRRQQSRTDSPSGDFNDYRDNTPPIKTAHKKDINVQLDVQMARVFASDREVIV